MRNTRRGFLSGSLFLIQVVMVMALALPTRASAQSTPPGGSSNNATPDLEWGVKDSYGFKSKSLSLGALFTFRVEGRTLSPSWSSDRPSTQTQTQKSGAGSGSGTERKPLDSKVEFQAEYNAKPVSVVRQMRVDLKRRAVRILDIFTNTESQERNVRVEYATSLSDRGNVRFGGVLNQSGESREYGNGAPENTVAALFFAERPESPALPLFVWGQNGARWPVQIQDAGSTLSLGYEGTIPANGKVALLHWVAVAGLEKGVKLERTSDLFWKDDRLVDPMVPADIAPLVVNFTPDSLKAMAAPTAKLAQAAGRLVSLEELCGKLSISREEQDVLWMGKDERFRGEVTGTGVQLKTDSASLDLPLVSIAAIRGGGGRGREHRVYLRNGAVLTGRASLQGCRLSGELGSLTLDADALELLLLRVTEQDGKAPPEAGAFVELRSGAVHWLGRQDGAGLQLVTVFGGLPLQLAEIWSLERRKEPPFNLIVTLGEGSRIHGVAQQSTLTLPVLDAQGKVVPTPVRPSDIVRLGSSELLTAEMAIPGIDTPPATNDSKDKPKSNAKTEPPARYCWLRDGSLLVGTVTNATVGMHTNGNEVQVKSEDIVRMTLDANNGNLASIELRSGAKMQGELLGETLGWQLGPRKISLPVGWLLEMVRKEQEASPPAEPGLPPKTTARLPGENDPLAMPNMKREHMKEIKLDFPPSVVASSTPIAGTVSLPRLDRCDEESVKKRLTFLIPGAMTNVALKKPVTVSSPEGVVGVISSITDGSAKDDGGEQLTLPGGLQWVQIDLGEAQRISKIMLWHYHRMPVVYEDVIVQVSDDPNFKKDVKTIFNNDHDNTAGFGKGPDIAYIETNYGWLIDGAGAGGRYVRFYSRGNSYSEKNDYLEIMIFGAPRDPMSTFPKIDPERMAKSAVTLVPTYPKPAFDHGKPISIDAAKFPHLEKFEPEKEEGQNRLLVPRGTTLISFRKPVTSSAKLEKPELLARVTDGSKEFMDTVELPAGNQWVQIDLGGTYRIQKMLVWHEFKEPVAYHDVMVMISDHPEFKGRQFGVFNNDHDNSSGRGKGREHAYIESHLGRLIDTQGGLTGRYVRLYSNGNSKDDLNRYCEVQIWGQKIEEDPPDTKAANPPPDPAKAPTSLPGGGPMVQYLNPTTPNDLTAVPRGMKFAEIKEQKPEYPPELYKDGWDYSAQKIPNLEKLTPELINERKTFFVPNDASIVSKGKLYWTSSIGPPELGGIRALTDGVTDGSKGNYLEFTPGLQWVQVDLGSSQHIWKVLLWHFHRYSCVYYDVVVQVSDDMGFRKGVQVIFNNDHDNSSGLGKGVDPSYIETNYGRLIDGCGAKGRYVRFYSNGSTASKFNHYVEISIYGSPAPAGGGGEAAPEAAPAPPSASPSSTPAPAPAPAPAAPPVDSATASAPIPPMPPKPGTLEATTAASTTPATPNDPLALPKGMKREGLVEEKPEYPKPMFIGVPVPVGELPNLEKLNPEERRARLTFLLPPGASQVAKGKKVTTSAPSPQIGMLDLITDGDADSSDGCYVELAPGLQWVQIDLGATHHIWKVLLWHMHKRAAVYHDVIVQVSDDAKFEKGVQTIFNNDYDNSAKFGKGPDPSYTETNHGKLIDGCGAKGRYLRFYTNGSTADEMNHIIEAMVYGTKVGSAPAAAAPVPVPPPTPIPSPAPVATPAPPQAAGTAADTGKLPPNDPLATPKGMTPDQLKLETPDYPKPMYIGRWQYEEKKIPNMEVPDYNLMRERRTFRIPNQARVVSIGAKVNASVSKTESGKLDLITDTDAEGYRERCVELAPGLQWVQMDLGAPNHIWKVLLWHAHHQMQVYFDVVVQVSDDETFRTGVQTLFNNDHDNSSGLGAGSDPAYIETNHGRLIDGCGAKGRYLRFYSNGNTGDEYNRYLEIQVYGTMAVEAMTSQPNDPLALPTGFTPEQMELMKPQYPKPPFMSDFVSDDAHRQPNFRQEDPEYTKKRIYFLVPKGAKDVARGKTVTGSDPRPVGTYAQFTDGIASGDSTAAVKLEIGTQWVQVDLGEPCHVWKVLLWHDHRQVTVCYDLIVQVSDDSTFTKGVTTLFNNDHNNSSELGAGVDPAYVESSHGRLIDGCNATGRYVRFYSRGTSADKWNYFVETSIYGTPVSPPSS